MVLKKKLFFLARRNFCPQFFLAMSRGREKGLNICFFSVFFFLLPDSKQEVSVSGEEKKGVILMTSTVKKKKRIHCETEKLFSSSLSPCISPSLLKKSRSHKKRERERENKKSGFPFEHLFLRKYGRERFNHLLCVRGGCAKEGKTLF